MPPKDVDFERSSQPDGCPQSGRTPSVPLIARTDHGEASLFLPESLLREARRQKGLAAGQVPPVCLLDPDGDIVAHLKQAGGLTRSPVWACYHTDLWEWTDGAMRIGIIDRVVGASFAVLVAEQLFVSGCRLLLSVTSAGQITECGPTPYFILIERALRDEGTSYHYLPAADFVSAPERALAVASACLARSGEAFYRGATWTTDAPFRETASSVAARRAEGILAVEMEAAALYAFAEARAKSVICLAYVTNQLGRIDCDFEKGEQNGANAALQVIRLIARAWLEQAAGALPDDAIEPAS